MLGSLLRHAWQYALRYACSWQIINKAAASSRLMQPGFAPLFEWLSVHVKFNLVVGAADTMINSVSMQYAFGSRTPPARPRTPKKLQGVFKRAHTHNTGDLNKKASTPKENVERIWH
jgi:hypothetical protein